MKYVASSISQMTDYNKYYVYTGHEEGMVTGCWYFWSGTEWLIGGDYQCGIDDIIETSSTMDEEGMPADAKAVGDMIVVSDTEPTSPHTELWIDPDTESVLVPTMDDIEGTYAKKSEVESTYARKAAVGSPLRAATASAMTDVTKIYVYTGSETGYTAGHWYYYDGSSWADGGVYNSTAFVTDKTLTGDGEAADAKVTGDEIGDLKSDIENIAHPVEMSKSGDLISIKSSVDLSADITSESASLTIKHTGKNLLEYPYYQTTRTINGITFTDIGDGTIRASGTATASVKFWFVDDVAVRRKPIKKGTYKISGVPNSGGGGAYDLNIGVTDVGETTITDTLTYTISADTTYYLYAYIRNGNTVDVVFNPQIELGSVATPYEKYESEDITLTNGTASTQLFDGINVFSASSDFTVNYNVINSTLDNFINIKDYGAVGDGVTDDTDAIIAALNEGTGKSVLIPAGTYLFSKTLPVKTNTKFVGYGNQSVLKLATTNSLTPYVWREEEVGADHYRYPYIFLDENTEGCVLSDFVLVGQTNTFSDQNEDGIAVCGKNHRIENITIHDIDYFPVSFSSRVCAAPGMGIYTIFSESITIDNCVLYNCGYECIGTESCDTVVIKNCKCGDTNQTGIQIHRLSKHVKIYGNSVDYSDGNTNSSLTLHAFVGYDMEDIHIDSNYLCNGMTSIGGYENNIYVTNNRIGGTISFNGETRRKNWQIIGNIIFGGGIVSRIDNAIIALNSCYVTVGYFMINHTGHNSTVINNIGTGSVTDVRNVEPS